MTMKEKELLDALDAMARQCCGRDDGTADSMAISAFGEALELLAEYGRFVVEVGEGRRVFGRWHEARDNSEDKLCCDYCDDGGGHCAFPYFGVAPHDADHNELPESEWTRNFVVDPDSGTLDGGIRCGTYLFCWNCGRGGE